MAGRWMCSVWQNRGTSSVLDLFWTRITVKDVYVKDV
jgi:hypothetical protein